MKKAILTICRGIYPYSVGGVEIHVNRVSAELVSDYNVTVVFESDQKKAQKSKWKKVSIKSKKTFLTYSFTVLFACIRWRIKPDVIIAHTAYAPLIVSFVLSTILNAPYIVVVHGSDIRIVGRTTWLKYAQRMLMTKAAKIVCISKEIQRILLNEYRIKECATVVIPNGFDPKLLSSVPHEVNQERPKLVFVGRLCWQKDPLTALEAIKELKKRYPKITLSLFGNGGLKKSLESFVRNEGLQENVRVMGQVVHSKVIEAVGESDLLILTSIHEGLPTAVIEAMAMAKPVIATNIKGVRELLKNGQNGLLVPPQDPHTLALRIDELLSNIKRALLLGRQARADVSEFTWQHVACLYSRVIRDVIGNDSKRCEKHRNESSY